MRQLWVWRQKRRKIKREKEKYYLYLKLGLLTLGYTSWVRLSRFQKSQPAPNLWYLFISFFAPLSSIISILSNFDGIGQIIQTLQMSQLFWTPLIINFLVRTQNCLQINCSEVKISWMKCLYNIHIPSQQHLLAGDIIR